MLGMFAEAHPEVIGESGVATEEAYQKDLAYLKEKVCTCQEYDIHVFCFIFVSWRL